MTAKPSHWPLALTLALAFSPALADEPASPKEGETEPFRGVWVAEKVVDKDREITRAVGTTWEFTPGKIVARMPEENRPPGQRPDSGRREEEYGLKYDRDASPKTIDLKPRGPLGQGDVTLSGIYEADGETLRLCFAAKPGDERPKKIEAGKDSVLVVLKRPKEEP